MKKRSIQTFLSILAAHAPEIVPGRRASDRCEQCHLWSTSVVPQYWSAEEAARADLESVYKPFFAEFDRRKRVQESRCEPNEYAKHFVQHLSKFIDKSRANLSHTQVYRLHELIASILHSKKWRVKVLSTYTWHRRSAGRQKVAFVAERDNLEPGHVLIVLDWKENLSLPMAVIETSSMYWTSVRVQVSCFGGVVRSRPSTSPQSRQTIACQSQTLSITRVQGQQ